MPKANEKHTTKRLGADPAAVAHLTATMNHLHTLAVTAMASGVASVASPDQAIFDLADLLLREDRLWRGCDIPRAPEEARVAAIAERDIHYRGMHKALRDLAKIPATTPQGLYAKAVAARTRYMREALCDSLANDLINNPHLRAIVWPATVGA
jgi:hypothetical protein